MDIVTAILLAVGSCHPPIGWLNAPAEANILLKLLHEIGLQLFIESDPELLNAVLARNIWAIFVTLVVSQDPKSWLNRLIFLNIQVPIAESLAMQTSRGDMGVYGRMRVWGSVGFILAVMAGGLWFDWVGVEALPATMMLVLGLVALTALGLPAREVHAPDLSGSGVRDMLRQPKVRGFLWASFLMLLAHAPLYTLFSLWLEQNGYSRTQIGLFWTLGVLAEILMFRIQRPLFERFGLARAWSSSYAIAAIRFGLIAISAGNIWVLLVAQLLHAVTFGVHHSASMALVREWFPQAAQARGQALYTMASYGLGGSLGGILAGWVWESVSPQASFGLAAAFAGLGWLVARRAARA